MISQHTSFKVPAILYAAWREHKPASTASGTSWVCDHFQMKITRFLRGIYTKKKDIHGMKHAEVHF